MSKIIDQKSIRRVLLLGMALAGLCFFLPDAAFSQLPGMSQHMRQQDSGPFGQPDALNRLLVQQADVGDLILHGQNRTLCGRVVSSNKNVTKTQADVDHSGRTILLIRDGQVVAQTQTNRFGHFYLDAPTGGQHLIALQTPQGLITRTCRLWTSSAAPGEARELVELDIDELILRGQMHMAPAAMNQMVAARVLMIGGLVAVPFTINSIQNQTPIPNSP